MSYHRATRKAVRPLVAAESVYTTAVIVNGVTTGGDISPLSMAVTLTLAALIGLVWLISRT